MSRKSQKNRKLFLSKILNKYLVFTGITAILIAIIVLFFYQLNQKKLTESIKKEAQSITKNSIIKRIDGLQIWLESSSPENFDSKEAQDGANIDKGWKGVNKIEVQKNNSKNNINQVVAVAEGEAPIYANSINSIPAIKFQGESLLTIKSSAINNSDYTIVIVEQRESSKADNYILGDPSNTTANQNLLIGYKTDGSIIHSQGGNAYYTSSVSGYSSYNGARVLIFTHSAIEGNKTYINGVLAGQSVDADSKGHINNLSNLAIGKNYVGQIGELAVYNKVLSISEIQSIYDYTINKWRIKVGATKEDCSNGLVASYSCDLSSCSINIAGISRTQVRGTISTSYLKCDKTGYTGSITYSCNNKGLITYPTNASCSCAIDYYLSNGVCVTSKCNTPTGLTGVNNYSTSGLISTNTTGTATCGSTGYSGNLYYKCNNTIIEYYSDSSYSAKLTTTPSCSCASGYSLVGGVCAITCTTSAGNGYNSQSNLPYTGSNTSTFSCASGVNFGSVTYRCQSLGVATIVSNTCSVEATGNNGTCSCNNYCAKNWNGEVTRSYPSATSATCIGAKTWGGADISCGTALGSSQRCYCQPSTSGSWVPYGSSCQ